MQEKENLITFLLKVLKRIKKYIIYQKNPLVFPLTMILFDNKTLFLLSFGHFFSSCIFSESLEVPKQFKNLNSRHLRKKYDLDEHTRIRC